MNEEKSNVNFWEYEMYRVLTPFLMGQISILYSLLDYEPWQKSVFFIIGIITYILAVIILISTMYKRRINNKSTGKGDIST